MTVRQEFVKNDRDNSLKLEFKIVLVFGITVFVNHAHHSQKFWGQLSGRPHEASTERLSFVWLRGVVLGSFFQLTCLPSSCLCFVSVWPSPSRVRWCLALQHPELGSHRLNFDPLVLNTRTLLPFYDESVAFHFKVKEHLLCVRLWEYKNRKYSAPISGEPEVQWRWKPGKWDYHGPTVKSRKSRTLVLWKQVSSSASHWWHLRQVMYTLRASVSSSVKCRMYLYSYFIGLLWGLNELIQI